MPAPTRPMTKSPKEVAAYALEVAERSLPTYSAPHSPKLYTQHQLFAMVVLKQFFRTDLRGIVAILNDSSDLREVLGLKRVPHYSTLSYAQDRFFKGGVLLPHSGRGRDRGAERTTPQAKQRSD